MKKQKQTKQNNLKFLKLFPLQSGRVFWLGKCTLFILSILLILFVSYISYNSYLSYTSYKSYPLSPSVEQNINSTETATISHSESIYLPILMYHHVGGLPENANGMRNDLTVSVEDFERQVVWIKDQGFSTITLAELRDHIENGAQLPKKPVVFTFDDGYKDVFSNAVPILQKYGFVGSFAVITSWVGDTQGDNVYASWDEIKATQTAGMEIVSHTQTHFDGTNTKKYSKEYIKTELEGSRKDLQNHLGIDTKVIIYPYGHYSEDYINTAKEVGYILGITTKFGNMVDVNNLMQIPRIRVHGNQNFEKFKEFVSYPIVNK